MGDLIHVVVIPCLCWAVLFVAGFLILGLDKLRKQRKLKRTNNGTPPTGVNSKEDTNHG